MDCDNAVIGPGSGATSRVLLGTWMQVSPRLQSFPHARVDIVFREDLQQVPYMQTIGGISD